MYKASSSSITKTSKNTKGMINGEWDEVIRIKDLELFSTLIYFVLVKEAGQARIQMLFVENPSYQPYPMD